jgi:pimeloyl-ACP methyl ester carboxylesterase
VLWQTVSRNASQENWMARQPMGDVIVLIPGILGSVLSRDGHDVWAPTPGAAVRSMWTLGRSIGDLALARDPIDQDDVDSVVATRLMPDVHIIPGLWGIDGYTGISAMITSTFDVVPGKTFIEFPYDWRRDNRVAARQLSEVAGAAIREQRLVNPNAKLIVVGHSMGGLVARFFLECMDGWKDTRMLITFGTPYRGSLNALGFIANGFSKKIGPFKIADLSHMLRSFTSVYQLLPIFPCIDTGIGKLVRPSEASGVNNLDHDRAHSAEHDFHRAIEHSVSQRGAQESYEIHPIVGLAQPTMQSGRLWAGGDVEMLETYNGDELDGDGTVPRASATPIEFDGGPDRSVYTLERHASLQNVVAVQTQLRGLLSPVPNQQDFRVAQDGLTLRIDDLYATGEDVPISVVAGARRLKLAATVTGLGNRQRVTGPIPLRMVDDQLTHTVDLPALPPDTYRVEIAAVGEAGGATQDVHGVFVVAADDEPSD